MTKVWNLIPLEKYKGLNIFSNFYFIKKARVNKNKTNRDIQFEIEIKDKTIRQLVNKIGK